MRNVGGGEIHGAADLRRAFDLAFARPAVERSSEFDGLIGIRIAGDAFAIRLSEISSLASNQKIVPLPGPDPKFLGIIGFQSKIIPVYSLRSFLGHSPSSNSRWVVLDRSDEPVGLAFDDYDGQVRIHPGDVAPHAGDVHAGGFIREAIHADGATRPILAVPLLVEIIRNQNTKIPHPRNDEP